MNVVAMNECEDMNVVAMSEYVYECEDMNVENTTSANFKNNNLARIHDLGPAVVLTRNQWNQ
jgi:hypothetical protein